MNFDLLKYSGFRNFFLGQAISQVGDALYYVSFMFMVERLTGDVAQVGYVGALEVLPYLLFSPMAGVLADRLDRRLILVWTDIICAVILFLMGLLAIGVGSPPVWSMYVGAFTLSLVRVFFFPARNACIPRLVPPERLSDAFALTQGTQNLVMMGGLALSAGLLGKLYHLSPLWFFVSLVTLNGLSFLLSGWFVSRIAPVPPERSDEPKSSGHEIREGVNFVRRRADLVTLMLTGMFFSLGVSPFFVSYIAANKEWFGGHPSTLSWFEFSFFGGMVLGTWLVGRYSPKFPGKSFLAALVVVGIGVGLMAFSRNFLLFALWNFLCGIAVPYADIPINTYLQLTVPDGFRGRVNALRNMLSNTMTPLGMATAGLLIAGVGLVNAYLLMGLFMLGTGVIAFLGKEFREAQIPSGERTEPAVAPLTA